MGQPGSREAQCSSGGLWANTAAGHKPPSFPGPVYRSAWPSLGVITAKCTDNAINKHTADSRGANITPNINSQPLSKGSFSRAEQDSDLCDQCS